MRDDRVAASRLAAPRPVRPPIERGRLLDPLRRRFEHAVTTIVAGPGFGKTTLLAQVHTEHALDPRGDEIWISCHEDDAAASVLAAAVGAGLGLNRRDTQRAATSVDVIVDHLERRSPTHVCLLVDDVHLVADGSTGAAWLHDLLDALPANAHVVLAGRTAPPFPIARRLLDGSAQHLGERDLAFDDEEAEAFSALRLAPSEHVAQAGGWPALAELIATSSGNAPAEYVWQEILAALPAARTRRLAVLAAIGRADDALLSAAVGERVDVAAVTRSIPLVTVTPDGWAQLHDLWLPVLAPVLDDVERASVCGRAAEFARDRGDVATAVRLWAAAGNWDEVLAVVRAVCSDSHPLVAGDVLTTWRALLGTAGRTEPAECALLDGAIRKPTDPLASVPSFEVAARRFEARGDRDGEAAAIFHLGHIFWWHEDYDGVSALVDRCLALAADGSELAVSLLGLGGLVLAELADDPAGLVAAADAMTREHHHPEIAPIVDWLAARGRLLLGDPGGALGLAERARHRATPTMRPAAEFLCLACLWSLGDTGEVFDRLDAAVDDLEAVAWAHNRAADGAQAAIWCALDGRLDAAAAHLTRARRAEATTGAWARALLALAAAVVDLAHDDPDRAAHTLAAELRARPLTDPAVARAHRAWVAFTYVLAPETRAQWDATDLAGIHADLRAAARALVALREPGRTDELRALAPVQPPRLSAGLPPAWRVELAVGLEAAGRGDEAAALLQGAGPAARTHLVRLRSSGASTITTAAAALLRGVARVPTRPVGIEVLGTLRVTLDDEAAPAEHLARRAVRELLLLLVEHAPITRDRIAAMLWPDSTDDAARNNLRVHLSYLNRALEPDRDRDAPPFFVEEHGDAIALVDSPLLSIDVRRFQHALAAARDHDRDGAIARALEHYLAAAALYRGDYLADAGDREWADLPRQAARRDFVVAAVRAGELLLARAQYDDAAQLAQRVITEEPWSEAARRLLVEAYAGLGDRAGAIHALDACRTVLDDLGVGPEPATLMLARRLGLTHRLGE